MIDDNDNDNQREPGQRDDTSGDSVEGDDDATVYLRTFIRAALAVTPLSTDGQEAAMILIDDVARSFREHREHREEEDLREQAEKRLQELMAEEDRAERERAAARRLRDLEMQARDDSASAEAALQRVRLEAAVQECQLRQDLANALSRAASAEAALAAQEHGHWAGRKLRAAVQQQERHIVSTVEIAEGLGASRIDLEGALRQYIAELAADGSRLTLHLLLSPLGGANEGPAPQVTSAKGKRHGVA